MAHRLVGPLYHFERVMKEFEATAVFPKAMLRDYDLLEKFCVRFNSFDQVMHER